MHRTRATLIAVLALSAAVTDAQAQRPSDRWRGTAPLPQFTAPRSEPRYSIFEDPTVYGLAAGQGIANAQVVLTRRRDTGNPKDVVGSAGEIVAKAVSGAAGGVTFENVPSGQYVVTITVSRAVSQQVASMSGEIQLPSDLSPYRRVKSYFESRSNIATLTISGQEWRTFANVPYVYAVRGVSLANEPAEVRTDPYSTVIAQQFTVPDGNPATVRAAIGQDQRC